MLTERRAKTAVYLYCEGVPVREIARRLACSEGTVKQALQLAQEGRKIPEVPDAEH
jgi:DNA-directed RNA polymerase specialized sigma24 family protein